MSKADFDQAQAALYQTLNRLAKTPAGTPGALPFIPFAKIDADKHEVWGWAGEEALDMTGREIMDYDRSKPHWVAWSERVAKISNGKSLGNVRGMHNDTIAAGKLIHFEPRDDLKKFWVGAKIIDPLEWYKVSEGVYNGFSPGGSYGQRWPDPGNPRLMRYEAIPIELTLADLPAMYGATFEMIKAAGQVEMRKFAAPDTDVLAKAIDLEQLAAAPRNAWYAQFVKPSEQTGMVSSGNDGYVCAVLDDRVIVERGDGKYAYTYTHADDGSIVFDPNPVKVQVEYVPADLTPGTESTAAIGFQMTLAATPDDLTKTGAAPVPQQPITDRTEPAYADPIKKTLRIDTEPHIRAAWNHLQLRKNRQPYSRRMVKIMRERIADAWRKIIDPAGPPAIDSAPAGAHVPTGTQTPEGGERIMKTLTKAAKNAVDPQEVIGMIQALRNQAELDGDMDAAGLYSGAIATIMDAAFGGGSEEEPDSGEDTTKAGDVPDAAAEPPAEGATAGGEPPAEPPADDAMRMAAHALRAKRLSKTAAPAPTVDLSGVARSDDLNKVIGAVSKLGETLDPLAKMLTDVSDRLANLEAQPAGGGPILRASAKIIAGQTPDAAAVDAKRDELMKKAAGLQRSMSIEPNPLLAAQYQRDLLRIEGEIRQLG